MARRKDDQQEFSRRAFLNKMRWAPVLFSAAPIHARAFGSFLRETRSEPGPAPEFADFRITPHYPAKSPIDDVLRKVAPGADEYITEKYAFEIMGLLDEWSRALKAGAPALGVLAKFLDASLQACSLVPIQQKSLRSEYGIEAFQRRFGGTIVPGRDHFLQEMKTYLASMARVDTAEFEITGIEELAGASPLLHVEIRYDFAGTAADKKREGHIGQWRTQWSLDQANGWQVRRWEAAQETFSRARAPIFIDVTSQAFGETESYKKQ